MIANCVVDPDERLRLVKRIADWAADALVAAEEYKKLNAEVRSRQAKEHADAAEAEALRAAAVVQALNSLEAFHQESRRVMNPADLAWMAAVTACTELGTRRKAAEAASVAASLAAEKARAALMAV